MITNWTDIIVGGYYRNINIPSVVVKVLAVDKDNIDLKFILTNITSESSTATFMTQYTRDTDYSKPINTTVAPTVDPINTTTVKNTFKKDEQDNPTGKPIPGALDVVFLNEVAKVLAFGAKKYGRDNWKKANAKQRILYVDAMFRHIFAALSGEQLDVESGCHHWAHAVCNIMFLFYWRKKK